MIVFIKKIVLVLGILAAMIILLLGLNNVFTGKFDADDSEAKRLRKDVERNKEVISRDSVFNPLVNHSHHIEPDSRQPRRSRF